MMNETKQSTDSVEMNTKFNFSSWEIIMAVALISIGWQIGIWATSILRSLNRALDKWIDKRLGK